jgi:hypothetical protein
MRISGAGLTLLTALAVAACGGSGSTTISNASKSGGAGETTTVTRTATAATGTATGQAGATTGQAGTGSGAQTTGSGSGGAGLSTTGSGSGAPPCQAAGLGLSFLGGQGATGHGELGFALRNTGTSSCGTVGYPGVQFLDGNGGALPTSPTHTTSDFFGHTALRALTVAPGQSVSFRLGVTHNATAGQSCTTADGLQVIAPNDTATLRVDLPGGAAECGVATVSPMQSGDSAYP